MRGGFDNFKRRGLNLAERRPGQKVLAPTLGGPGSCQTRASRLEHAQSYAPDNYWWENFNGCDAREDKMEGGGWGPVEGAGKGRG